MTFIYIHIYINQDSGLRGSGLSSALVNESLNIFKDPATWSGWGWGGGSELIFFLFILLKSKLNLVRHSKELQTKLKIAPCVFGKSKYQKN